MSKKPDKAPDNAPPPPTKGVPVKGKPIPNKTTGPGRKGTS